MTATIRQELTADMSLCWAECNSALQELDNLMHKTVFGAGRRRTRSAARNVELEEVGSAALFDTVGEYLESLQ